MLLFYVDGWVYGCMNEHIFFSLVIIHVTSFVFYVTWELTSKIDWNCSLLITSSPWQRRNIVQLFHNSLYLRWDLFNESSHLLVLKHLSFYTGYDTEQDERRNGSGCCFSRTGSRFLTIWAATRVIFCDF